MDKFDRQIHERLKEEGAQLVRHSRHAIYRLPNGRNFVRSKTPGDWRSSRKSLTELRKRLAETPKTDMATTRNEKPVQETAVKKRFVSLPREATPRLETDFRIISGAGQNTDFVNPTRACRPITSLMDLVEELETLDEFWIMKTSGRTALLKSFISEFARVESILVRFGRMEVIKSSPGLSNHASIVTVFKENFSQQTLQDHWRHWKQGGFESLLVNDPELGKVVVDVCASRRVGGRDDIVVIPAEFDETGKQITYWPAWLSDAPPENEWDQHLPDWFISYAFYNRIGIRKWGIENFSAFSTKAKTRNAVRALRDRLAYPETCSSEGGR